MSTMPKHPHGHGGHDVARQARRLVELRHAILARVVRSAQDFAALHDDDVGSSDRGAKASATAALYLRLDEFERREVAAIDAALTRVARGTWGRCTTCGDVISAARLEILPDAAECIDCARGTATKARSAA